MTRLFLALTLLGVPTLVPHVLAAPPARVPAQTRVAILPVVINTDEKDEKVKADQATRGEEEARKQFADRGFVVVDPAAVTKAYASAGANARYKTEADRAVGVATEVGTAVQADWVVVVVIDGVELRRVNSPITDTKETIHEVVLRLWVNGRAGEEGLPSGDKTDNQLRADAFEPGTAPWRRQKDAVAAAVRVALRGTLAPYPSHKENL
ncbi:MAG: hypothetical protein QM758_14910 [Armatimonas sp.]